MHSEKHFRSLIEDELKRMTIEGYPSRLYDPIRYMIGMGGKRLRPALLLMTHELFNGKAEDVIQPALGIEVFHNFTLLHDDIMDKAPLRRSFETVHKKWNPDIAILSGDTMFVKSCQLMMNVKKDFLSPVLDVFFKTAVAVCEGQQMDMDFESEENISIADYIHMITLKTASLLGCASYIGALCAGSSEADANHMYEFAKNLGIAFQLNDDILDAYGDPEKTGKQTGGDILANKKTFLLITALQKSSGKNKSELEKWLRLKEYDPVKKINSIIEIYNLFDVRRDSSIKMENYLRKSLDELNAVNASENNKEALYEFAEKLMVRES